jgi:hypothetical protein
LENNTDKQSALLVKGRIERTTLGDVRALMASMNKLTLHLDSTTYTGSIQASRVLLEREVEPKYH